MAEATKRSYMRPNAVDAIYDKNTGNNLGGDDFPYIHFEEVEGDDLTIELMLKGGGCENVGAQYHPCSGKCDNSFGAGVTWPGCAKSFWMQCRRRKVRDARRVFWAFPLAVTAALRMSNPRKSCSTKWAHATKTRRLAELEERLTSEANEMGIGPMGFGGKTTVLDTKITGLSRLPASYFVSVSYMCWAYRRRKMTVKGEEIIYD